LGAFVGDDGLEEDEEEVFVEFDRRSRSFSRGSLTLFFFFSVLSGAGSVVVSLGGFWVVSGSSAFFLDLKRFIWASGGTESI
jgi:hypothetical protein